MYTVYLHTRYHVYDTQTGKTLCGKYEYPNIDVLVNALPPDVFRELWCEKCMEISDNTPLKVGDVPPAHMAFQQWWIDNQTTLYGLKRKMKGMI